MEWLKAVGALILALSGIGGAAWLNRSASSVLVQIEGWQRLLRFIKLQIDCFSLPVSVILERCDRATLRACGYVSDLPARGLGELWERCSVQDEQTREIVRGFVSEFGKGYREEQLRSCDYYLSLLEQRRGTVAAQLPGKKKRNATLCVSGALAVVILLI